MTAAAMLAEAAAALAGAGIAEPRREARLLLAHAAGVGQAALLRDLHAPLVADGFAGLVRRRAAREPLALITGRQGFWTLDLAVSADTLIPRADSEAVVEAALAVAGRGVRRILDLGTGTGCLLLALLAECPGAVGVGVDRSLGAARLARRNAAAAGLSGRAAILCGDWMAAVRGAFDLVVSNPPYVETAAIGGLMPEVACHEPRLALDGGADGLSAYRAILDGLAGVLAAGGVAVLELGAGQGPAVAALAAARGFAPGPVQDDLGGVARAMVLRRVQKSVGSADAAG